MLARQDLPADKVDEIVEQLIDQLGYALAAKNHKLGAGGRGPPLNGPANVLSGVVADILERHGLRGCWLLPGDEEEDGAAGPVAEIEAILQSEVRLANGEETAAMPRPARISKARQTLGKIFRE